jgi:hypothetical protein
MKCEICKKNIEETFLKKIVGTHVKDSKGKMHAVCPDCQKKLKDKSSILQQLQ